MSDATNDPAAVQADIERTRADLASTVDQLSGRLGQRKKQATKIGAGAGAAVGAALLVYVVVRVVRKRRS